MATVGMATTAGALRGYMAEWLGAAPASEQEAAALVEAGLPNGVVQKFLDRGLSRNEVFELILPLRTWKHRKARQEPLSVTESERALRAARLLAQARQVMGEPEQAMAWVRAPKRRFEGRSPLQMMATEPGGRLVEEMLVQIDEGMFA
ncbi:MAG TPA: antitoxin Xre/MbcA/ParS toxin-binding domain-containing protein [Terriglobales bacterium]